LHYLNVIKIHKRKEKDKFNVNLFIDKSLAWFVGRICWTRWLVKL